MAFPPCFGKETEVCPDDFAGVKVPSEGTTDISFSPDGSGPCLFPVSPAFPCDEPGTVSAGDLAGR